MEAFEAEGQFVFDWHNIWAEVLACDVQSEACSIWTFELFAQHSKFNFISLGTFFYTSDLKRLVDSRFFITSYLRPRCAESLVDMLEYVGPIRTRIRNVMLVSTRSSTLRLPLHNYRTDNKSQSVYLGRNSAKGPTWTFDTNAKLYKSEYQEEDYKNRGGMSEKYSSMRSMLRNRLTV